VSEVIDVERALHCTLTSIAKLGLQMREITYFCIISGYHISEDRCYEGSVEKDTLNMPWRFELEFTNASSYFPTSRLIHNSNYPPYSQDPCP
jgi:hypothetical protein